MKAPRTTTSLSSHQPSITCCSYLLHLLLLFLTTNTNAMTINPPSRVIPKLPNNVGVGKVAVVTGASRGIGRGIAIELGRAGYTVYALGRSSRQSGNNDNRKFSMDDQRPVAEGLDLTVESVAEEISSFDNGAKGYAVPVDLRDDEAIARVLEDVSKAEGGRLDVIVCSAYTVPPGSKLRDDFWKQGMEMWDAVNELGLRQVYNTCCRAVPYMIDTATGKFDPKPSSNSESSASVATTSPSTPLICLVSSFGGKAYTFNVSYGVGKAAIDRLASDMAYQLRSHNVATVALYPGLVQTEGNLQMETDGTWDEASGGLDLSVGETPGFSGKAVVALASLGRDELMERSGHVEVVAELAKEMKFTEEDGSRPDSIRSLRYILPNFAFPQIERETGKPVPGWIRENVPDLLLPWSVFSSPPPETE